MSAAGATLLASFVGVFGVLAGLVVERALRSWGRMWCEPTSWKIEFYENALAKAQFEGSQEVENPIDAKAVRYEVWVDLHNDKEVPTGLRDLSIVFDCDERDVVSKPLSLTTSGVPDRYRGTAGAVVRIINLAPRQWDFLALYDEFDDPEDVRPLAGWRKADLVGQRRGLLFGRPEEYRKTVATNGRGS